LRRANSNSSRLANSPSGARKWGQKEGGILEAKRLEKKRMKRESNEIDDAAR